MSYFFIAQIDIHDDVEYQKYIDQVDEVFVKFNGKYLVVDNDPIILEGKWNYARFVMIEFATKQDFSDWYYSTEYQNILKHRLKGARCDTVLVRGK